MRDNSASPYGGLRRVLAVTGVAALVVAGGSAALALADTTPRGPANSGTAVAGPAGPGAVAAGAADSDALMALDAAGPGDPPADHGPRVPVDSVVIGTVTALSDSTITIRTDDGRSVALPLSQRLQQFLARPAVQKRLAAHPAVGRRVVAGVTKLDGTDTAVRIHVVHPHVLGTVVAVDNTTWTVTDVQGATLTVDVGDVEQAPTVVKGDVVLAIGTFSDSSTLKATRVVVNPHGRALRAGHGLKRGPAGHRGPGGPSRMQGPAQGPAQGSTQGSTPGSTQGSMLAPMRGTAPEGAPAGTA